MEGTWKIWLHGIAAAGISGAANGIVTGFSAMGIAPDKFNLGAGMSSTLKLSCASAACSAILGVAAYLKASPLP